MFFLVILSFLLPLFSPQAYGAENEVITFGKQEGFNFIIAVPETPGTLNSIQFSRIVSFFSEAGKKGTLPDARISVISTKNDYSRLPENLRPEVPEGTAGVISMLEQESSGIVILVLPEEETGITTVKYGVKYETSPPELLTAVTKAFDESRGIWKLEETKIELPYLYYPGYEIEVNGEKQEYYESETGFIQIDLNNKEGEITVKYTGTILARVSFIISMISLLVFIIYNIVIIKKELDKKKN